MTAHCQITARLAPVNADLVTDVAKSLWELFRETEGSTPRELEVATWGWLLDAGRSVLEELLGRACRLETERVTAGRAVTLRLDKDYTVSQKTTLGPVTVPTYAYREDGRTHAPAKAVVFPLHPHCRSSELLLEWACRAGAQLPFRQAEQALHFYSHGAVEVEDTTIARHLGVVGAGVTPEWTSRTPEQLVELLNSRATRDAKNGRPLLYVSCDAHALRRYVDDTWTAKQKMINGLRFWCVDEKTGQTLHVAGDYTWGDCREVASRLEGWLERLLPADAAPQLVFIADGMPWFEDHLFPVLPEDTVYILDFYHLTKRLADYAAHRFGAGSKKAKRWVAACKRTLTGKRSYRRRVGKKRKGHQKRRRTRRRRRSPVRLSEHPGGAGAELLQRIVDDLGLPCDDALLKLIDYLHTYVDRADYALYRHRGMQIGSGAMESLHRTASQMRLKLAGARWTPERAIAVLNTRLMLLAERWDDFWGQHDLSSRLREAFTRTPVLSA